MTTVVREIPICTARTVRTVRVAALTDRSPAHVHRVEPAGRHRGARRDEVDCTGHVADVFRPNHRDHRRRSDQHTALRDARVPCTLDGAASPRKTEMTNQDTTTDTTVHALVSHWLGIACDRELLASTVATDHSPIPDETKHGPASSPRTALLRAATKQGSQSTTCSHSTTACGDSLTGYPSSRSWINQGPAVHCPRPGPSGLGHKGPEATWLIPCW